MAKNVFEGVKILDFAWIGVGCIASRYLAVHGATVVHVESHARPDLLRIQHPSKDGGIGINLGWWMDDYNTSKLGISLDLSKPKGQEIARKLVSWADVVTESFAHVKVMHGWGLGYEDVVKFKPDIIYYSTSQVSSTGPIAGLKGGGTVGASLSGSVHFTGWPDRLPSMPYGAYSDFIAPRFLATALLAALDHRRRTGKGCYLDQGQWESAAHFYAHTILNYEVNRSITTRMGNRSPYAAPHGAFKCKGQVSWMPNQPLMDDRWCVIAVRTDEEWKAFCHTTGHPEWITDPRFATLSARKANEDELERLVEGWTANYDPWEVMTRLQDAGVPAGVVQAPSDLYEDPQLKHRSFFQSVDHIVKGPTWMDGVSFQLSKTPAEIRPAPALGQHNEHVYKKILGFSDEEIADLIAEQVITNEGQVPSVAGN